MPSLRSSPKKWLASYPKVFPLYITFLLHPTCCNLYEFGTYLRSLRMKSRQYVTYTPLWLYTLFFTEATFDCSKWLRHLYMGHGGKLSATLLQGNKSSMKMKPNRLYSGALLRHWNRQGCGTKGQNTLGWLTKVQRLKSDPYSYSSLQSSKENIFNDTQHIVSHWLGMRITTTLLCSSVIVLSKKEQSRQERMPTKETVLASTAWLNALKQWLKFRRKAYVTIFFF